jgi:hypothetical protein
MTYRGRVKNGEILLDEPVRLPEGAIVHIDVVTAGGQFLDERRSNRIILDPDLAREIATSDEFHPDEC